MVSNYQISDKTVLKNVVQNMTRKGTGSNRIVATVQAGTVTITGTMDFEHQRRSIISSTYSVAGVKRVVDQLRVEKKPRV